MKKLFAIVAVTVAVAMWYAVPVFAAEMNFSGDYRVRGYVVQSPFFTDDDADWIDFRFRLTATVKQGITTGVVQVDFLDNTASSLNGNSIFGEDTGGSHDYLGLRQAYLTMDFPHHTMIAGKYELKIGNGLVLNDTVDLIGARMSLASINLFLAYLVIESDDDTFTTSPAGEDVAYLLNADLMQGAWMNLGAFALWERISETPGNDAEKLDAYGVYVAGMLAAVKFYSEFDIFMGDFDDDRDYKGMNFIANGSVPLQALDVMFGVYYATGQDEDDITPVNGDRNVNHVDGDYRIGNIIGRDDFNNYEGLEGLGDVAFGSSGDGLGLQAIKVAGMMHPMHFLGADHSPELGLVYANTSEEDADGDSDIGIEVYLNTNCVYDKFFSANLGLAYLMAGDAVVTGTTDPEDQLKLELSGTYRF